jgi:hypothetical protein
MLSHRSKINLIFVSCHIRFLLLTESLTNNELKNFPEANQTKHLPCDGVITALTVAVW